MFIERMLLHRLGTQTSTERYSWLDKNKMNIWLMLNEHSGQRKVE